MASDPFTLYLRALRDLFNGDQDWDSDPHYVVLLDSSYTPDLYHETFADIKAHECANPDYSPQRLQGATVSRQDDVVICRAHNVSFGSSVTISARFLAIVQGDIDNIDDTDPLVGFILMDNTPADVSVFNQSWTVKWDQSFGIFRFWDACDCAGSTVFVLIGSADILVTPSPPLASAGVSASPEWGDLLLSTKPVAAYSGARIQSPCSDLRIISMAAEVVAGASASTSVGMTSLEITPLSASAQSGAQVTAGVRELGITGLLPDAVGSVGDVHAQGDMVAQYSLSVGGVRVENVEAWEIAALTIIEAEPEYFFIARPMVDGQICMWQDLARTQPVTTAGDPVRSMRNLGTLGGFGELISGDPMEWDGYHGLISEDIESEYQWDVGSTEVSAALIGQSTASEDMIVVHNLDHINSSFGTALLSWRSTLRGLGNYGSIIRGEDVNTSTNGHRIAHASGVELFSRTQSVAYDDLEMLMVQFGYSYFSCLLTFETTPNNWWDLFDLAYTDLCPVT